MFQSPQPFPAVEPNVSRGRILLVDDGADMRTILTMVLKSRGFDVTTAEDGLDGYNKAIELLPDVVLTDYQMPVMNGIEGARLIRENPATASTPIVIQSGYDAATLRQEASKVGINAFLCKPVPTAELVRVIESMVALKREHDAERAALPALTDQPRSSPQPR